MCVNGGFGWGFFVILVPMGGVASKMASHLQIRAVPVWIAGPALVVRHRVFVDVQIVIAFTEGVGAQIPIGFQDQFILPNLSTLSTRRT